MSVLAQGQKWWNQWSGLLGAGPAFYWLLLRIAAGTGVVGPGSWRMHPRQVRHPLTARLRGNSSDMNVFHHIFVVEEYSVLRDLTGVSLVVDLGANVGYSSAYLLSCFPEARVLAVEPEHANWDLCRRNLAPYGNRAEVIHGAVWSSRTRLNLSRDVGDEFGDGREWAVQVHEPPPGAHGEVEAYSMDDLLERAGGGPIDLLKIDIEGAEREVLGWPSAGTWLRRVRNLCIEVHGDDCKRALASALADFDCDVSYSGELTICRNLRPKNQRG